MGMFQDKCVLVTGGASGIGQATAEAFAREQAIVVIADIDVENGHKTIEMLQANGGEALFIKTDVTQRDEVRALLKRTIETYGRLDCAFNNAGIDNPPNLITKLSEKDWDRVIDVNLKGVWLCMKYEIPHMVKQGGGAIVNTSSVAGLVGTATLSIYSASKHGVLGLTKTAALEFASKKVRVNAICPGVIRTPLIVSALEKFPEMESTFNIAHPLNRIGEVGEVASMVLWLCSEAASFVTGQCIAVDGGFMSGRPFTEAQRNVLGL